MQPFNRHTYILSVGLLAACGGAPEPETSTQSEALYVHTGEIWNTGIIPVCWENPSTNNATERGWVFDAVESTWGAETAAHFTGWGPCHGDSAGVRIRIADEGPHTEGLGRDIAGCEDGMVLNFTFNNWSTDCAQSSQRESCIRDIAVHEFGHALGFAHEQNRPDTPSWCDQEQGTDGTLTLGAWDLTSVMNYCNPAWNGNGQLSAGDIAGARAYYGPPDATKRVFRGLPISQYQEVFEDFVAEGFRPLWVDVTTYYPFGTTPGFGGFFSSLTGPPTSQVVNGIFVAAGSTPWRADHALTKSGYEARLAEMQSRGFRLVHVDAYASSGSVLYAPLFEQRGGSQWTEYHDVSIADHQARYQSLGAAGYRPVNLVFTPTPFGVRVTGLWDKNSVGRYGAYAELSPSAYQAEFQRQAALGRHLVYLDGYYNNGPKLSAIWDSTSATSPSARHGADLVRYREQQHEQTAAGRSMRLTTAYPDGWWIRYGGAWQAPTPIRFIRW